MHFYQNFQIWNKSEISPTSQYVFLINSKTLRIWHNVYKIVKETQKAYYLLRYFLKNYYYFFLIWDNCLIV